MSDRVSAYTDEVRRAMQEQGLIAEPEPVEVLAGQIRYHVAVDGYGQTAGQTTPAAVAAALRTLANQIDQGVSHG